MLGLNHMSEELKSDIFEEDDQSKFEEDNHIYLSKSALLHNYELKLKQPIQRNKIEKDNPNAFLTFLDKTANILELRLAQGTSASFLTDVNEFSLEQKLDMLCQDFFERAIFRSYLYLVLMQRRALDYTFYGETHSFDLRDVYHLGGIELRMFNIPEQIPSDITRRMKINSQSYRAKADNYEQKFIKLEKQLQSKHRQLNAITQDDESTEKVESKLKTLEREIYGLKLKIEKLSFDMGDELITTTIKESPTPEEVIKFIAYFVCYGIRVEKATLDRHFEQGYQTYQTNDNEIIKNLTSEDLYFQDLSQYVWVKGDVMFDYFLNQIAPKMRTSNKQIEVMYDQLIKYIQSTRDVSIFSFKHHCLFMKNGVIPLQYQEDGSIQYQFIAHENMTTRKIMFDYATHYRTSVNYDDTVSYVFDDNPEKIEVTPDFIYGSLGERGFEDNPEEAERRANLLMQYTLKILMPFDDLDSIKDTFLYFYNSANSGKSTYMKLMNLIVGNRSTVGLETKDLSSESFGLINVKDKRLVLVDEATNGKHPIETDNIKRISAKERIDTNVKNKAYSGFTPTAEMIFASNPEPSFTDESEGTERRLLGFQLESSYQDDELSDNKDLVFIKQDLIYRNAFQSACIKWLLNHINVLSPKPQSVRNDALALISKEDDVQGFIHERIRQAIDEPLFINIDHLYALYKLESLTKGRRMSNIRNKANFKKALMKMRSGVYQIKSLDHSNVDTMNRLLHLEGVLFEDYFHNISNNELNNNIIKTFMDFSEERKQNLKRFYDQVIKTSNKELKLAEVSRKRSHMICILPDTEMYNVSIATSDLTSVAKIQKKQFLEATLKLNKNIELIKNNETNKLPFPINPKVSNRFAHYSMHSLDKDSFNEFVKYNN